MAPACVILSLGLWSSISAPSALGTYLGLYVGFGGLVTRPGPWAPLPGCLSVLIDLSLCLTRHFGSRRSGHLSALGTYQLWAPISSRIHEPQILMENRLMEFTKMSRLKADSMNSTLCRHVFCFLSKLKGQNHVGMLTGFAFAFAFALLLLHLLLPT